MNATKFQKNSLVPANTNTFALPEDDAVKFAYAVFNPPQEALQLESEKRRVIFAEAFITNQRHGTLSDLCAHALAKANGPSSTKIFANDPLKQRVLYDAMDIEQPLEDIYQIKDIKFWRRLALAKTKNPNLKFKKDDFDWRGEGIALKYVELVELCPAEFWPEEKMNSLAEMIKDFVTDMHINKLQSLQDYSFDRYLLRDSDTDKATSTDVSYTTDEGIFNRTSKTSFLNEEEAGEEEQEQANDNDNEDDENRTQLRNSSSGSSHSSKHYEIDPKEAARLAEKLIKKTNERRSERRARREAQQLRRDKREAKRQQREEDANKPKPKRIRIKNVFDLPIDEPADDEEKKIDRRNMKKFLAHKKSYNYPPEHCNHIDLRFIRHFVNLISFAIEFHPPELKDKYHQRHFNFSYEDVKHLASGISDLMQLRTFRLRDSRMNATKLEMLVASLNKLNLEVIDFGNDQLNDDAEDALFDLFQNTTTIKSLELEGNKLGAYSLARLGKALKRYGGVLKYLGLARNPIDTESLHGLCSKIVNTPQIEELCLAGLRLSEMGILCCIADELLRRHKALRILDMMAVPLSSRSGEMLISAMRTNFKVIALDCRGCNLDEIIETDLALCIKRNIYISKNPYIGDSTQAAADVENFLKEIKNPVLLSALEEIKQRNTCLESRADIAERFSTASKDSTYYEIEEKSSQQDIESERRSIQTQSGEESEVIKTKEPFFYKPNEFNEEQFHEHVQLPGPGQRYYYFQTRNRIRCAYID